MLLFLSLLLIPEFRPHGLGGQWCYPRFRTGQDAPVFPPPEGPPHDIELHTCPSSLDWKPHRIFSCLSPNTWGPWDAPSSVPHSPLSPTTLRHCAADSLHPRHTHVCYQHIPFGSCGCSGLECCLLLWKLLSSFQPQLEQSLLFPTPKHPALWSPSSGSTVYLLTHLPSFHWTLAYLSGL